MLRLKIGTTGNWISYPMNLRIGLGQVRTKRRRVRSSNQNNNKNETPTKPKEESKKEYDVLIDLSSDPLVRGMPAIISNGCNH